MNWIDHCLKEKKIIALMKYDLGGKIMTKFVGLRAKAYSYLVDDISEDKIAKVTKNCIIKRKLTFEDYNNWLKATQLQNEKNYLGKNKINIDSLKKIISNL